MTALVLLLPAPARSGPMRIGPVRLGPAWFGPAGMLLAARRQALAGWPRR